MLVLDFRFLNYMHNTPGGPETLFRCHGRLSRRHCIPTCAVVRFADSFRGTCNQLPLQRGFASHDRRPALWPLRPDCFAAAPRVAVYHGGMDSSLARPLPSAGFRPLCIFAARSSYNYAHRRYSLPIAFLRCSHRLMDRGPKRPTLHRKSNISQWHEFWRRWAGGDT